MLLPLLLFPAEASSPELWAALHNGQLVAATEQDPAQAAEIYEVVLDALTDDTEPMHEELLYWLAMARFEAGDIDGALQAIQASDLPDAANLRGLIEAWAAPVSDLPYRSEEPIIIDTTTAWRLALSEVNPGSLHITLKADKGAALLQLTLTSLEGRQWEQDLLEIADGEWQEMSLSLADLRPVGHGSAPPREGLWMISITPAAPLQGPLRISSIELR